MIFPAVVVPTEVVFTVKLADELLAATVTEVGTVAAGFALASVTTAPLAGSGPVKLTVPVALCPPVPVAGFKASEFKLAGADGPGL